MQASKTHALGLVSYGPLAQEAPPLPARFVGTELGPELKAFVALLLDEFEPEAAARVVGIPLGDVKTYLADARIVRALFDGARAKIAARLLPLALGAVERALADPRCSPILAGQLGMTVLRLCVAAPTASLQPSPPNPDDLPNDTSDLGAARERLAVIAGRAEP